MDYTDSLNTIPLIFLAAERMQARREGDYFSFEALTMARAGLRLGMRGDQITRGAEMTRRLAQLVRCGGLLHFYNVLPRPSRPALPLNRDRVIMNEAPQEQPNANTTPVLFRYWQGDIIALFPFEAATLDASLCNSYQHVGQHNAADIDAIIAASRPATLEERAPLYRELESAPYFYVLRSIDESYMRTAARVSRLFQIAALSSSG